MQDSTYVSVIEELFHSSCFEYSEHGLGDIEGVAPVVVLHGTIVFLHAQYPTTEDLNYTTTQ